MLLVLLVHCPWPTDKLVEAHEKRANALRTSQLMLRLAPELCHPAPRASDQLHDLPKEGHELVELFLCYEKTPPISIENEAYKTCR